MGQHILPGNPPVELILRRSARARRISLRVSGLDGRVTLTLPRGVSEREGIAFAREKEIWLRGHLDAQPEEVAVAPGAWLPVEGAVLEIRPGPGRSVRRDGGALLVPGDTARVGARVQGWLRTLARDRLAAASDRHAAALGLPYTRITLRDTRSRWGSCSSQGALMYSWRLILAPPDVLNYVAAHEVAHLKHMDHSRAFWAQVEALFGDPSEPRGWLREHGPALHRYRFGA